MMMIQPSRFSGKWRYLRMNFVEGGFQSGTFAFADVRITAAGVRWPLFLMTSNSTPAPLSVTATPNALIAVDPSNAFKVFDGENGTTWNPESGNSFLTLDFGMLSLPPVQSVSVTQAASSDFNQVENIYIDVSANGTDWTRIAAPTGLAGTWSGGVAKVFTASAN